MSLVTEFQKTIYEPEATETNQTECQVSWGIERRSDG
jgi:hypothetical protein